MQILSAEQFVAGLIAALGAEGKTEIHLNDPLLDEKFSLAYDDLLDNAETLGVVPDFVISPDPLHGDSTSLRDAILAVRDMRSVALHNPKFVRLSIDMKGDLADKVMEASPVPVPMLRSLAKKYLSEIAR